jgi:integrase
VTPSFALHVHKHIGSLPVDEITTDHVLGILEPLWRAQPETATKLRARVEAVLDFARTRGWRAGDNPARWGGHLEYSLPARRRLKPTKHHAAMAWQVVPTFLTDLRKQPKVKAKALEFMVLNASRSGEVFGAMWDEIDFDAKVWTIGASRMKGAKEHRVPLTDRALVILREMEGKKLRRHGNIIFPGRCGQLAADTFFKHLQRMGLDAVPHGFRSSFRDWCIDNGKDSELAEFA